MKAPLITFEGPDGCGKSTLCVSVAKALSRKGLRVYSDVNPSHSVLGELIRSHLRLNDLQPQTFLYLFLADRIDQWHRVLLPRNQRGEWILVDRFSDSSVVYQSYALHQPVQTLSEWVHRFQWFPHPHRTYVLQVPYEEVQKRLVGRRDLSANDRAGKVFFENIQDRYLQLGQTHPARIKVLEGSRSVEQLTEEVLEDLSHLRIESQGRGQP